MCISCRSLRAFILSFRRKYLSRNGSTSLCCRVVAVDVTELSADCLCSDLDYATWSQMTVLNNAFVQANISFSLAGSTFTEHEEWSRTQDPLPEMGQSLRQGDYATLNIYLISDSARMEGRKLPGTIGVATPPEAAPDAEQFLSDGVLAWQGSLPGSRFEQCDMGLTVVHEVGHWLGLDHVFDEWTYPGAFSPGPCSLDDGVADTPLQYSATVFTLREEGCPMGKDTCPLDPGVDNVSNFMDYSSDFCMEGFTPGQFAVMRAAYQGFRLSSP